MTPQKPSDPPRIYLMYGPLDQFYITKCKISTVLEIAS